MGRRAKDMTGLQFGRLTVLRPTGTGRNGELWWDCRCACGRYTEVNGVALRRGRTKSCGCLAREVHAEIARTLHIRREPIVADVMLHKRLNGLFPCDDASAEVVRALGQGEIIRATVRKPRNVKFHRKFFALLQLVNDATDKWPNVEQLLVELKFRLGHVDTVQLSTGELVRLPRSISFAKMDDTEFAQFFDRSLKVLCEMAGDIDEDYLRESVLQELAA